MESIKVFTDGGCSGNPGPGAWAFVILYGTSRFQTSGSVRSTTNNRMELKAVISALNEIHKHSEWKKRSLDIYTDSRYVEKGITDWIIKWERNGWLNSSRKPVKNQDLWKELKRLSLFLTINWNWLQAHAGNELNEECDRLVRQAIKEIKF